MADNVVWQMRRQVWQLAWPASLEMVGVMVVGIVTTAMVGRLGPAALAAVGLGNLSYFSLSMVFGAVGAGATAIVARSIGAGRAREASRVAGQAVLLGAVMGLLLAAAGLAVVPLLLPLLAGDPQVAALTDVFLRVSLPFAPLYLVMVTGNAVLRGSGNTRLPFLITTSGNVLTILIAAVLVFGRGPAPALGALGVAWGYNIAESLNALVVLTVLLSGRCRLRLGAADLLCSDWPVIRRIVRLSVPAGGEQFLLQMGRLVYTFMLVSLGTVQFAAHQIALQVESISFLPGFGFSVAATTLVGQQLGRRQPDQAARYTRVTAQINVVGMGIMALLFLFFAVPLVRLFTADADVLYWGAWCVRIAALEQPTLALTYVYAGALRGAGDTRWPMFVTGIGVWLVRMPLIFLLVNRVHGDIYWAWVITALDFAVRSAILWQRFRRGGWRELRV